MSMREQAERYLEMRRSLGCAMTGSGRMVMDFAAAMDTAGQTAVTITTALDWATQNKAATPGHWRARLSTARGFARHMNALDPASQLIPPDLIPAPVRRKPPYLYSAGEIAALVHAAGLITTPAAAAAMQALISLIAASGLRSGEALSLDRTTVDLENAVLTVTGKNGLGRLVPLHQSTVAMLARYADRRDQLCPQPSPAFFVTRTGRRATQRWADETFARLLALAGITAPPGRRRPRIHDLRHIRRRDRRRLVPRRPRRPGPDAGPVRVPGPLRPGSHLLVLLRFPGYSDTCSFPRVMRLWPGLTRSGDSRLSE
jgi:integrase